ncbi:MAG: WD repeat-containing protein 12 [Marteilia pararefringens]
MTGQVTLLDFEHSDEDSIVLQHALKTPVECLLPLPMSLTVLAGCYDNSVKLIDLRSSGESLSFILNSFTAHQNVVSRLVIDPLAAQNCFFSGSFDSSLKLWDIRHPARPLIDIRDHTGRVLSLAAAANHVVSGSTDGHLQLYNRSEM